MFNILLCVLYLAWHSKAPRQHHLDVALHCTFYAFRTRYVPLVLGGHYSKLAPTSYSDASLGSGPKGKSIMGSMTKLNPLAGAVCASSTATTVAVTNIFEGELDSVSSTTKDINRIMNTCHSLQRESDLPQLHADNLATNNFVKGEGIAAGSRHMQLRLWYVRGQYDMGKYNINHIPGINNPADTLTKLADSVHHFPFAKVILGLSLLDATTLLDEPFYRRLLPDQTDDPTEYPFLPAEMDDPITPTHHQAQVVQVQEYHDFIFDPIYPNLLNKINPPEMYYHQENNPNP